VSDTFPLKAGRPLLNISSDFSIAGPLIADAAFYVFERSQNKKSMVFFAAKKEAATPGASEEVSVYAWETESLLSEYIEKSNQLIVQIRNARKQAVSIIENEWKYSYQSAAEELRKTIFSGLNKRDREQAADAEKVFRDLVQKKDQKSIVFVRMRNEDGNPVYLPLGILAASSSSRFLDKRIILVQPLPREHYPAGVHPVGSWTFNIPEELAELSKISNNALKQLGKDPPYRRDISTVKAYFKATEPAAPSPGPEGVLLLAHQAGGNLWFNKDADRIIRMDIERQFPAGSVAILSACSTASSEGNNQAILEKLNANGIDAMIISPFPVHADYGAMLAINFVKAIEEAKDNSKALSLAELFSMATAETASYFNKRGMHFDDMDLEFLIAGDYRIKIAPK
jgi:PHD/YefM family antitoxin component YafN of YafNO toxin-antitoxin module